MSNSQVRGRKNKEGGNNQIGSNIVHINDHFAGLPRMEALVRIANIPIVETGVKTAGKVYSNLKQSNGIFSWSFNTAEGVLFAAVETVRPAVKIIEGPLNRIDQILCNSLDIVEQRVPSVYLPPQMLINNTKEYMSDHLVTEFLIEKPLRTCAKTLRSLPKVQPVLKRAGSVKQLGSAVLDSPFSAYAAHRIDGAINVADKYVEKYLPSEDQIDSAISEDDNESQAMHTFHKSQRFSRKLKRRLTQRTIAEARALKKQSKEAIHILIYAAELIATDPKLAMHKARELWMLLSKDEPENQARPQTIEELIVLITRESARRVVHLVNYTSATASKVPTSVRDLMHNFLYAADSLIRTTHLERAKMTAINEAYGMINKLSTFYGFLQIYTSSALERLAYILAGRMKSNGTPRFNAKKGVKHRYVNSRANNNPIVVNNVNGAY